MEGDEELVQTFGIEPKIWTMTSTTMSLEEKKSKFREMELKHEVNHLIRRISYTQIITYQLPKFLEKSKVVRTEQDSNLRGKIPSDF